jgi:hypothetical protein
VLARVSSNLPGRLTVVARPCLSLKKMLYFKTSKSVGKNKNMGMDTDWNRYQDLLYWRVAAAI